MAMDRATMEIGEKPEGVPCKYCEEVFVFCKDYLEHKKTVHYSKDLRREEREYNGATPKLCNIVGEHLVTTTSGFTNSAAQASLDIVPATDFSISKPIPETNSQDDPSNKNSTMDMCNIPTSGASAPADNPWASVALAAPTATSQSVNPGKQDMNITYPCSICHKMIKGREMTTHRRSYHPEAKPYRCFLCSFEAAKPNKMFKHRGLHQQQNPLKCPYCIARSFRAKGTRTQHILKHHPGLDIKPPKPDKVEGRPFKCNSCGAGVLVPENLKAQVGVVTVVCVQCRDPFKQDREAKPEDI